MKRNLNWLDRIMLAVTFAEGNCPDEARSFLAKSGSGCTCGCSREEVDEGGGLHPARAGANHCH
jgi:hypothetical protein